MDVDEFLVQYEQGRRDFSKVDFGNIYFCSFHFQDIDFSYSNWSESIFEDCLFTNVSFQNAQLIGVKFANSNIGDCSCRYSPKQKRIVLKDVDFAHADLTLSSFDCFELSCCNFESSCLDGCNFKKTNLNGVNLRNASLVSTVFHQTDLRNANLSHANLTAADLWAQFDRPWDYNDLTGANLSYAILKDASLRHVKLENSDLTDTDFAGVADLEYTQFSGSNLTKAANLPCSQNYPRSILPPFSAELGNPNTQLVMQLSSLLRDVYYDSESSYSYICFLWPAKDRGELSIYSFLDNFGFLQEITEEQVRDSLQSEAKNYPDTLVSAASFIASASLGHNLTETLSRLSPSDSQDSNPPYTISSYIDSDILEYVVPGIVIPSIRQHTKKTTIYKLIGRSYTCQHFVVLSQLNDGIWLGITLKSRRPVGGYSSSKMERQDDITPEHSALTARLINLRDILENCSYSGWCNNKLVWEFSQNKEDAFEKLLCSARILDVQEVSTDENAKDDSNYYACKDMFRSRSCSQEKCPQVDSPLRAKEAGRLFKSNLKKLRAYEISYGDKFYIYYLGQASNEDWIGVHTQAIWT